MRPELSRRGSGPANTQVLELFGHGMTSRNAAVLLRNSSRCAFFVSQMVLLLSDKHSDIGLVYPVLVQPSSHKERKREGASPYK